MPIYKQTTEITNIDDIWTGVDKDIVEIYFGNKNVFTVWGEYEGTLPATLNANGDDMRQYQVWGNTGGVGEEVDITGLSEPLCGTGTYTDSLDLSTGILTRRIKKLVLTGDESDWRSAGEGSTRLYNHTIGTGISYSSEALCNVAEYSNSVATSSGAAFDIVAYQGTLVIRFHAIDFTTLANFKSYLAAQYSAGTPVTVWYVLAQPEVSTITIPSGLTGTIGGYLIQDGTPKPGAPIYPTANGVKQTDDTYSIKYGYKLDMATGSNILQDSEIEWGGWQAAARTIPSRIKNPARCRSKNMYPISGEKIFHDFKSLNVNIPFINSNGRSLGATGFKTGAGSVDVPANAVKCLFIIANTDTSANITPAQVIAAGIWASVDATTTPIYIGSEPLDKDEYIDYQAGKIYRYETEIKKDVSQTGWQWRWTTDDVTYQATVSNRVSVGRFYPEDTKEYIISAVPDTFEIAVISADESDVKTADTGWGASWTLSGASAHSFCVSVKKSDNSDITPSEVDGVKFKVTSLAPTDPPVALPALPTCKGETIVDYAGQSVAPEKALLKYRKKNF